MRNSMPISAMMVAGMLWISTVSAQTISQRAGAGKPAGRDYAPGEVIVKLREPALKAMGKTEGASPKQLASQLPASLRALNRRFGVQAVEPTFPHYAAEQRKLEAIKSRRLKGAALTKEEARLAQRLERAPQGAAAPRLDAIFKAKLNPASGASVEQAVALYQKDPNVEYAEPNWIIRLEADAGANREISPLNQKAQQAVKTPNDSLYTLQWALNNTGQEYLPESFRNRTPGAPDCDIDAPEAWASITGGDVTVAVIDTGLDLTHRDLKDNLWVNAAELNGKKGTDDDGNGYVDDVYGFNFIDGAISPADDHGHGTHCAGIIAARGNNGLDISGICWNAKVMALKFIDQFAGKSEDAARGMRYATANGADVISCSFGSSAPCEVEADAIRDAISHGVVVVAAAGNDWRDFVLYPAAEPGVITVGASDSSDQQTDFTNYGCEVDVCAPGDFILSLMAGGTRMGTPVTSHTTLASGTSMACPHVSGTVALMLAKKPTLTVDQVSGLLKITADAKPELDKLGAGRINLAAALTTSAPPLICRLNRPFRQRLSTGGGSFINLKGAACGASFTSYTLEYGSGNLPSHWTQIKTSKTAVTSGTLSDSMDIWEFHDGVYVFRLWVADKQGHVICDSQMVNIKNIAGTYPQANDILKPGKKLTVKVMASDRLIPDSIAWRQSSSPEWLTQGITLKDGVDGVMGIWDTASITTNTNCTMRLTAHTSSGRSVSLTIPYLYMDTRLRAGWPQYAPTPDYELPMDAKLTVDDLDGDRHAEIIWIEPENEKEDKPPTVVAYRDNGQVKWRRNLDRYPVRGVFDRPICPPAIGDLDGDGKKEIVVESGADYVDDSLFSEVKGHAVYALRNDGTVMPGWPILVKGDLFEKLIADLDRDGRRELVLREMASPTGSDGQVNLYLYVIDAQGEIRQKTLVGEKQEANLFMVRHGMAVGQFDNAPDLEIATYALKADGTQQPLIKKWNGAPLPGWPLDLKAQYVNNLMAADVNGDGYDELLFVANMSGLWNKETGIYVVDRQGKPLPGWPVRRDMMMDEVRLNIAMSVGDINGDQTPEVLVSRKEASTGKGLMEAFNAQGEALPGWPVTFDIFRNEGGQSETFLRVQPILGDINGDGQTDVICAGQGGIWAWKNDGKAIDLRPDNRNSNVLPMEGDYSPKEICLGDIDGDGRLELVAASCGDISNASSSTVYKNRDSIYVWNIAVTWEPLAASWPTWQHDSALSGNASFFDPLIIPERKNAAKSWRWFK